MDTLAKPQLFRKDFKTFIYVQVMCSRADTVSNKGETQRNASLSVLRLLLDHLSPVALLSWRSLCLKPQLKKLPSPHTNVWVCVCSHQSAADIHITLSKDPNPVMSEVRVQSDFWMRGGVCVCVKGCIDISWEFLWYFRFIDMPRVNSSSNTPVYQVSLRRTSRPAKLISLKNIQISL